MNNKIIHYNKLYIYYIFEMHIKVIYLSARPIK